VIIIFLLFFLIPAVQIFMFLQVQEGIALLESLNFICSIFAVHGIMGNIFLASKLPILQKVLPYDKRIRIHIMVTIPVIFAFIYHAAYKILMGYNADLVIWLLGIVFMVMIVMSVLWIPLPGLRRIRLKVHDSLRKYDKNKSLHAIFQTILGLLIIFHTLLADILTKAGFVSTVLYIFIYVISMGSFFLSKLRIFRIGAMVSFIQKQNDTWIIHLIPEKQYRYLSGQFTFFSYRDSNGRREEHPFSILSFPGEYNTGQISLAIKELGDFTRTLKDIKVGDMVSISKAFGRFYPEGGDSVCFIGSGIGVVPLISNLKHLAARRDTRHVQALLSVRYREDIPELEKLMQLERENSNFSINILVSSEERIRFSEELFQRTISNINQTTYYLCASGKMLNITRRLLSKLGVEKKAVHFESFAF